jgi:hypothetical protein
VGSKTQSPLFNPLSVTLPYKGGVGTLPHFAPQKGGYLKGRRAGIDLKASGVGLFSGKFAGFYLVAVLADRF